MPSATVVYGSPAIAKTLARKTQKKTSKVQVTIKGKEDVSKFIADMYTAQKATSNSKLLFK